MEESRSEMAVLDIAGNEGSPSDDRARPGWGLKEDKVGGVGEVEFGVHVDEVVAQE